MIVVEQFRALKGVFVRPGQIVHRNTLLLLIFFGILGFPGLPGAVEPLSFNAAPSGLARQRIDNFTRDSLKTDPAGMAIARADLNEDGLDEYILKAPDCDAGGLCGFTVLANAADGIVEIGTFRARKIALGNSYSANVRNIVVYNDPQSDFAYQLCVWEPRQSRYILNERN